MDKGMTRKAALEEVLETIWNEYEKDFLENGAGKEPSPTRVDMISCDGEAMTITHLLHMHVDTNHKVDIHQTLGFIAALVPWVNAFVVSVESWVGTPGKVGDDRDTGVISTLFTTWEDDDDRNAIKIATYIEKGDEYIQDEVHPTVWVGKDDPMGNLQIVFYSTMELVRNSLQLLDKEVPEQTREALGLIQGLLRMNTYRMGEDVMVSRDLSETIDRLLHEVDAGEATAVLDDLTASLEAKFFSTTGEPLPTKGYWV